MGDGPLAVAPGGDAGEVGGGDDGDGCIARRALAPTGEYPSMRAAARQEGSGVGPAIEARDVTGVASASVGVTASPMVLTAPSARLQVGV